MSTVLAEPGEPGSLVQVIWLVFVGWWIGFICTIATGLPIGSVMLDMAPAMATLERS